MASRDSLEIRSLLAESKVVRVADDQPVAIRIAYTGASTSAPVISVITATSLTLTTSLGATVYTFSTYTNLGLLVAGINSGLGDGGVGAAEGGFTARLMDGIPTMSTETDQLKVSAGLVASTVEGETVYDVLLSTAKAFMLTYRVSLDRNVLSRRNSNGHRVKLSKFVYNANVSAAEAGAVRIYEYSKTDGTTTLVWAATSVDSTGAVGATTLDFSDAPLTAKEGNDLIVMIMDTTSLTDNATNYLQVSFIRE